MKAITCSQCGALIKRIRISDKFAECEYCFAAIPIEKEKVVELPDKKVETEKKPNTNINSGKWTSPYEINIDTEPETPIIGSIIVFGGISLFIIGIAFVFLTSLFTPLERASNGETPTPYIYNAPNPSPISISDLIPKSTPIQDVKYRAYVKYDTYIGAEHIEIPTIEAKQLTTFDNAILKKSVFKEKRIRVQITINKDGEVTEAKALNGHEVLKESSVRAAKKSLFSTRKSVGKTTLTYIFVLEE